MTIYGTADFHVLRKLFRGERSIVPDHIEWDAETGGCYLLGFQRGSGGAFSRGFVARLVKDDRLLVK
ncbi:hypothetical protein [uncultured Dysosmobacter sp.]|uniref:hypothetical protein n=1 Tax=uncultured Dysosmobacter sp. TaxID=2591384 RepID=UPI002635CD23|nr:hypothetical protein [uncultured Dysosmobacter sp.]